MGEMFSVFLTACHAVAILNIKILYLLECSAHLFQHNLKLKTGVLFRIKDALDLSTNTEI